MISNKKIKSQRHLPIYNYEQQILEILKNDNKLILIGETGCGKTTQIPQILYKHNFLKNGCLCITQPRRVAAISVSFRVAQEVILLN